MKKNSKKTLLLFISSLNLAFPIVAISCAVDAVGSRVVNKDYDFGLATNPINNLNYVKYRSLDRVLPSLVDSYMKEGPTDELRTIIPTDKIIYSIGFPRNDDDQDFVNYVNSENGQKTLLGRNGFGSFGGSYQTLEIYGLIGGLVRPSDDNPVNGASVFAFAVPRNNNNYRALTGLLNKGLNNWSNGDVVTAQDMIDYIHYIIDFNTGSQKLEEITKINIRGVNEFLDAQKEYSLKFNKNYVNPLGKRKYVPATWDPNVLIQDPNEEVWESQTKNEKNEPIDTEEVTKIKNAALNIGYYTGQLFLDFSNEEIAKNLNLPENSNFNSTSEKQDFHIERDGKKFKVKLLKNPYSNPLQTYDDLTLKGKIRTLSDDQYSFTIVFDQNASHSLPSSVNRVLTKLYIINRKYVETEGGGIQTYGSDPNKFLTSSAFNIKNINLGPQGSIELEKNKEYFTASKTLVDRIKIFFQTDPTIAATWFEDGLIQHSFVPANRINTFWGNEEFRPLLKKQTGYGTIAFGLNLDYETRADSPLQDPDLRRALYYAINRQDLLKTVGWDFSFPVNTWTAVGSHKTNDGISLELYFNDQNTTTENNKTFDLQNFTQFVHLAKNFNFEKTDRTDKLFSLETAKFYIDRYKKNNPDKTFVKLEFLNNSTDEQIKAGIYLTEALRSAFGNYVVLEVKSLPENTYAAFAEEGKFDIIYQNYDRLGGQEVFDYVGVFFRTDEIDSYASRTIGFKTNPVGSFTYADWITDLYSKKLALNKDTVLKEYLDFVKSLPDFEKELKEWQDSSFDSAKRFSFVTKFSQLALTKVEEDKTNIGIFNHKKLLNREFISNLIEYTITPVNNIKVSREKRLMNAFISETVKLEEIQKLTADTAERLLIPTKYWNKIVELSYRKSEETLTQYGSRVSGFFSGNFSKEDVEKDKWLRNDVYLLVAHFEKIIRETVPVIPLMEVDTTWQITKIGGIRSLYSYSLQYAYDFTNPPRPGLPRNNNS